MTINWNTKTALASNYGATRSTSVLNWIVIHYTGNKKDTAKANANYFASTKTKAGANRFVDGTGVWKSTPIKNVPYSVGVLHNKKYAKYWGVCTNKNSINIEIACDAGNYLPTKKAVENAIELTKYYMKKYNIPQSHVVRHKDVCGKNCPAYWWDDNKWKNEFWNRLGSTATATVVSSTTKVSSASAKTDVAKKYATGKYKVTSDTLRIRKGPSTKTKEVGKIKKGEIYTITKISGSWGYLKSGAGWIHLGYCKKV